MISKIRNENVELFFDALLSLKDKEELYAFFDDICTTNEVLSIAQRFEVAYMLHEGKTYNDISKETGASTATISRVNRSVSDGNGSYDMIFERLEKKEEDK